MPWLLDTNILSEIRRLKPEPKVLAFIAARPLDELYISAVTLAELRFGIERLDAGERRDELNRWLTHTIRPMFHQRILPVTEDILFRWRVLMEEGRKVGHTYSQPDLIIAATALHHGFTVVTRDRDELPAKLCRHFEIQRLQIRRIGFSRLLATACCDWGG